MNFYLDQSVDFGIAHRGGKARWYAVHTRSNFEKRLADELVYKGFECYSPSLMESHRWSDRTKVVARPLFPGYVFARFEDMPAARHAVTKCVGSVRIVGFGGNLAAVPDEEVESIRTVLASGKPCFTHPYLREGDAVRVRRGPLKNLHGLLIKVKNQSRLVISVTLLSRSVSTEINGSDVEVVRINHTAESLVA